MRHGSQTPAARKSLGQNFLVDPNALRTIARLCEATAEDTIVEIGPGTGNLTERLLSDSGAGRIVAIEKDRRMIPELQQRFAGESRLEIIEADALDMDLGALIPAGRRCVAVGNLPYYVATEIHFRLLAERRHFRRLVLMFQREVAERIVAREGSAAYGIPSVVTAVWATSRVALRLPPGAFRPPPKVHSAVVVADVAEAPLLDVAGDPEGFTAFARASLALRRKTMLNAIGAWGKVPRELLAAAIIAEGLPPAIRAEACSPETLAALWSRLQPAAAGETR